MRQWRVGSLSMALVLVFFGVMMFVAQFKQLSPIELIMNGWSAVIILLGIEILLAGYFAKDENPRFKYDFFSIIVVFVIMLASLGFYALDATGLVATANRALAASEFPVEIPESRLTLDDDIKKIVVERAVSNLTIRGVGEKGEIIYFGSANVLAVTNEEALGVAKHGALNSRIIGDTLYLTFGSFPRPFAFETWGVRNSAATLVLPTDRDLEIISNSYALLDIALQGLTGDWFINSNGPIRVKLDQEVNLEVEAVTARQLGGNITWETGELQNQQTQGFPSDQTKGRYKTGEGGGLLQLISHQQITLDQAGSGGY